MLAEHSESILSPISYSFLVLTRREEKHSHQSSGVLQLEKEVGGRGEKEVTPLKKQMQDSQLWKPDHENNEIKLEDWRMLTFLTLY